MASGVLQKIEQLCPELRLVIMLQVSSLRDLRALIGASPAFYRAFLASKPHVLSKLLSIFIPLHIVPDAVAAVEASTMTGLIDSHLPGDYSQNMRSIFLRVSGFFAEYNRQLTQRPPISFRDPAYLVPLCRLVSSTDYFVADFAADSLEKLRNSVPNWRYSSDSTPVMPEDIDDTAFSAPLSAIERCRLQRAFFRFEVFRRVFHDCEGLPPIYRTWDPAGYFLSLFPAWEMEEFSCVCQYLIRRVGGFFHKIEVGFAEAIKAQSRLIRAADPLSENLHQPDTTAPHPGSSQAGNDDSFQETTSLTSKVELAVSDDIVPGYNVYSDWQLWLCRSSDDPNVKHNQREHIVTLVARGLPFVKCYMQLPWKDRLDLTLSTCSGPSYQWLDHLWKNFPPLPPFHDFRVPNQPATEEPELVQYPNQGWGWGTELPSRRHWDPNSASWPCNYNLRTWGYTIWDADRLRQLRVLDTIPIPEGFTIYEFPENYLNRRALPSLQQLVRGLLAEHGIPAAHTDLEWKKWRHGDEYELVGNGLY